MVAGLSFPLFLSLSCTISLPLFLDFSFFISFLLLSFFLAFCCFISLIFHFLSLSLSFYLLLAFSLSVSSFFCCFLTLFLTISSFFLSFLLSRCLRSKNGEKSGLSFSSLAALKLFQLEAKMEESVLIGFIFFETQRFSFVCLIVNRRK